MLAVIGVVENFEKRVNEREIDIGEAFSGVP